MRKCVECFVKLQQQKSLLNCVSQEKFCYLFYAAVNLLLNTYILTYICRYTVTVYIQTRKHSHTHAYMYVHVDYLFC